MQKDIQKLIIDEWQVCPPDAMGSLGSRVEMRIGQKLVLHEVLGAAEEALANLMLATTLILWGGRRPEATFEWSDSDGDEWWECTLMGAWDAGRHLVRLYVTKGNAGTNHGDGKVILDAFCDAEQFGEEVLRAAEAARTEFKELVKDEPADKQFPLVFPVEQVDTLKKALVSHKKWQNIS